MRLEHQEREYAYRATSADGVVLAGRVFDYDKDLGGGLAFWVDAIKHWVTLFVAGDCLVLLEAGGHAAKLSLHERAISSALASVNP